MRALHASHPKARGSARQRGVTLIELMVGVAIGILCVLTILQLLSFWEARKRTVTAGANAQMNGTLAQFTLDRDLRLAGHGFGTATSDVMGCDVAASNSTIAGSTDFPFKLKPVEIVQGVGGAPDEIRVLYGNSSYFVSSQPVTESAAETKTLKSRDGFNKGDLALMSGGSPMKCSLIELTDLALADDTTIEHMAGKSYTPLKGALRSAVFNPAGGTGTDYTTGRIFNLGPAPVRSVWKVDTTTNALTRYNSLIERADAAQELASDVVTLRAQYGIDASGNGMVEDAEWFDAAVAGTDWTRVLAVRFGVLVRSRQYERPDTSSGTPVAVSAAAPQWAGGTFTMLNVDRTTDAGGSPTAINGVGATNNWRNYRYRVYEGVVPLRNVIWGSAP